MLSKATSETYKAIIQQICLQKSQAALKFIQSRLGCVIQSLL